MIVLAPYRWEFDAALGRECWRGPGAGVDLRRRSEMIAKGGATGYGIFEVDDDAVVEGAEAFTGNATRDRQMWRRVLGGRADGDTPEELLWSQLTDEADDTGADTARPIRCTSIDDIELHFGGRKTRKLSNAQKVRQIAAIRRDLERVFDDVQAGKLPERTHRRMLAMEARKLGIRPRDLKPTEDRWRDEDADEPHTLLYDGFYSLDSFTQLSGAWSVSSNRVTTAVNATDFLFLRHNRVLSSADHEVRFADVSANTTNGSFGPAWRMSTDAYPNQDGYFSLTNESGGVSSTLALYSIVNNSPTAIGTLNPNVFTSSPQRGDATGSTIRASISLSTWGITVTNTVHTSGVRVGAFAYHTASGHEKTGSGFRATDNGSLAPTVSGVSPSSGPMAGGTAIELTGENFDSDGTINLGVVSATSVVVFDDTKATAVSPAGTGTVDVGMTTGGGSFYGAKVNGFTYTPATRNRRLRLLNAFLEE